MSNNNSNNRNVELLILAAKINGFEKCISEEINFPSGLKVNILIDTDFLGNYSELELKAINIFIRYNFGFEQFQQNTFWFKTYEEAFQKFNEACEFWRKAKDSTKDVYINYVLNNYYHYYSILPRSFSKKPPLIS